MPVADIMVDANKEGPKKDETVYCRHPFDETKRAYVCHLNFPLINFISNTINLIQFFECVFFFLVILACLL